MMKRVYSSIKKKKKKKNKDLENLNFETPQHKRIHILSSLETI